MIAVGFRQGLAIGCLLSLGEKKPGLGEVVGRIGAADYSFSGFVSELWEDLCKRGTAKGLQRSSINIRTASPKPGTANGENQNAGDRGKHYYFEDY